jgi:3-hydroxyisobutyrate dehydrogenase-like beta-hydroxyacid dehydrogenase
MGSSLLSCLARSPHPPRRIYCNLSGRSERTKKLSSTLIESGILIDVGSDEKLLEADLIISVLINDQAKQVAKKISDLSKSFLGLKTKFFVDLNALAPGTSIEIASYFEESSIAFVDGGIIGGPANENYTPYIPISGPTAQQVKEILLGFGDSLEVVGDKVGQASAMKVSFASITKVSQSSEQKSLNSARILTNDGLIKLRG